MPDILPPELINTPLREWQLNGVTLMLGIMVLGRVWKGLCAGGGLRGIVNTLLYGSKTQPQNPNGEGQ
jgi:hypothetical protein